MLDINTLINTKEFRKIFTKQLSAALNVPEEAADVYLEKKIYDEIDNIGKAISLQDSTAHSSSRDLTQLNEEEINNKTIKDN